MYFWMPWCVKLSVPFYVFPFYVWSLLALRNINYIRMNECVFPYISFISNFDFLHNSRSWIVFMIPTSKWKPVECTETWNYLLKNEKKTNIVFSVKLLASMKIFWYHLVKSWKFHTKQWNSYFCFPFWELLMKWGTNTWLYKI